MEAALRLLTKEALKDNNFGQTFFDNGLPEEDKVMTKTDLSKTNKTQFNLFTHRSEIKLRKQYKETKTLFARLMLNGLEEYDDVMGGMHLEPQDKKNDPDKIFKTYPSFDPVFMKV